jgi:hypothetical protein
MHIRRLRGSHHGTYDLVHNKIYIYLEWPLYRFIVQEAGEQLDRFEGLCCSSLLVTNASGRVESSKRRADAPAASSISRVSRDPSQEIKRPRLRR